MIQKLLQPSCIAAVLFVVFQGVKRARQESTPADASSPFSARTRRLYLRAVMLAGLALATPVMTLICGYVRFVQDGSVLSLCLFAFFGSISFAIWGWLTERVYEFRYKERVPQDRVSGFTS